ncbi:winged helix-turn-helix domain-containing protein [Burkholderia sp. Ac-20365]|jgi:DNA-binding winged helix-turn-helix (wHTH) protein|uniref:winged helix-turn-helix domain-containing protein n=1 Tax=Burkholderia sp. Ac-20365 TaxID=2703897 RepID=UPI00197BCF14|nr:winged helix-turn-helix domain-containing protein [Burkholderia sp. Ac-20365]MBN3759327.1 winged helix-turn-helix transcriptional regulator [Burkholderia sp. Ac-20365]
MKVSSIDVDLSTREIQVRGLSVPVGSRAFDILAVLMAARGQVVSIETILRKVWPDTVVEESNIRVQVCALRKALGEDRRLIQNIPGRGYRLTPKCEMPAAIASISLLNEERVDQVIA